MSQQEESFNGEFIDEQFPQNWRKIPDGWRVARDPLRKSRVVVVDPSGAVVFETTDKTMARVWCLREGDKRW